MDIKNSVSVEITGGNSQQNVDKLKKGLGEISASAEKTKKSTGAARDEFGRFLKKGTESTEGVSKGFKELGNSSSTFNKNLNTDLASSVKRMVGFTAVFAAASVAIKSTISTTKDFEQSVSQLSAITGAVGEDLEFYAAQSREIGKSTTLSASQAVTAFKLIASAKPDLLSSRDALAAVTKEAVTLAEAASISLPEAASALGNSLNQFGAGAEEASRFINVLAAGSKFGASSIADTSEALKQAGAAANAAGLSFESTNAGIQALAAGGINAAVAGTGLRNVLLILEQEADKNLRPSVVGLSTAIQNLSDKNLTLTETTEIFGRESAIAALTLIEQSDTLGTLTKNLTDTSVATEQAVANFDNLAGDSLRASSAMEELQLALGTKLTPALRESTQAFTDLTNDLATFVQTDEFDDWIDKTGFGLQVLATYLAANMVTSLGLATASFIATTAAQTSTLTATTALTVGFRALSSATGIGLVITAVALLTKGFYDLKKAQEEALSGAVDYISGTGGLKSLELAMAGVAKEIGAMDGQIETARRKFGSGFMGSDFNRLQDEQNKRIEFLNELTIEYGELSESTRKQSILNTAQLKSASLSVGVLRYKTKDLVEENKSLFDVQESLNNATKDTSFKMLGVVNVTESYTQSTKDLLVELEQQILDLGRTEEELFALAITRKMEEGATRSEILAVEELAGALYDEREEIKTTEQAKREAVKAHEKAEEDKTKATAKFAEESARQNQIAAEAAIAEWRDTRNFMADFFLDLEKNGDGALENLEETFKQTAKRIVAQWAASGVMKIFGMGGGGPNASGGFSLFGGGNGGGGFNAINAVGTVNSGLNVAGFGGLGAVAGNAGSLFSSLTSGMTGVNSMVAPATAAGGLSAGFSSMMSSLGGFITSPAGIAAGVLIAGKLIHDKTSDPDGFTREIGGMLVGDTPGATGTFKVDPFSSGFKPVGIAHGASQEDANKNIDQFRFLDDLITQATILAGGTIDLTRATLGGFGIDGKTGTNGTLFGSTGRTTEQDFANQLNSFSKQIAAQIEGLAPETMARLMGATGAQQIVDILGEVVIANEESKIAADKAARTYSQVGDFIIDSNGALVDSDHEVIASSDEFSEILRSLPNDMRRDIESALLELKGIEDINGLLIDSNGNLVDKNGEIITSQDNLSRVLSLLPAEIAAAVSAASGARSAPNFATDNDPIPTPVIDSIPQGSDYSSAFNKVANNLSQAGVMDLAARFPEKLDEIRQHVINFERDTGTTMSEGGLELYQSVKDATGMSVLEYGAAMKSNLANALGIGGTTSTDNLSINGITIDGSHAGGLNPVPFDGYKAELHKGESIKTKAQTDREKIETIDRKQELFSMNKIMAENLGKMRRLMDEWNAVGLLTRT